MGTSRGDSEVELDKNMVIFLNDLYDSDAIILSARSAILSRTLTNPFSFSIPRLGLVSDENMQRIIERHYMPWFHQAFDWWKLYDVVPFFFDHRGGIPIPRTPERKAGCIRRILVRNGSGEPKFRWYWNDQNTHDRRMQWYIGHNYPDAEGTVRTGLAALLPLYRLCKRTLEMTGIVVAQRARPSHVLERRPAPTHMLNDHLAHLTADFGAQVVGMTQLRREEARMQEETRKQTQLLGAMAKQQARQRLGFGQLKPVLGSDTAEMVQNEQDSGLATRLFALPEDTVYREVARPDVPVNYIELKQRFDAQAAAVMGFPLDMLIPSLFSGVGKAAAVQESEIVVNDSVRHLTAFFRALAHQAITAAYKPYFDKLMAGKDLHPVMDVEIVMNASDIVPDQVYRQLYADGLMTQKTMGRYLFQNHSLPLEDMVVVTPPALAAAAAAEPQAKKPKKEDHYLGK